MIHQQQLLLLQHQEQHWARTLDDSPTIATSSSTPGTTLGARTLDDSPTTATSSSTPGTTLGARMIHQQQLLLLQHQEQHWEQEH